MGFGYRRAHTALHSGEGVVLLGVNLCALSPILALARLGWPWGWLVGVALGGKHGKKWLGAWVFGLLGVCWLWGVLRRWGGLGLVGWVASVGRLWVALGGLGLALGAMVGAKGWGFGWLALVLGAWCALGAIGCPCLGWRCLGCAFLPARGLGGSIAFWALGGRVARVWRVVWFGAWRGLFKIGACGVVSTHVI